MFDGSRRHHVLALIAAILGGVTTVLLLQMGQLRQGSNPLSRLRTLFWHDQLGYLAIVANAREGEVGSPEPVTITGISHYPRLYYSVVGWVARGLGLEAVTSWNLMALALQFTAAVAVGLTAAKLSGRWWIALAAPIPFLTGTFAYLFTPDSWYTALEAHAVLWGPYGVLFSNNAEAAGLCVGIIAICAVAWVWCARSAKIQRWSITVLAACAVGSLSSIQTYSFLAFTYLVVYVTAIAGICALRRRALLLLTTALLVLLLFFVGPLVSESVGQLPTLMFGLLPAVPGVAVALIRTRGLLAVAGAAAAVAAAPQIVFTLSGIISGDPFLEYRVASNRDLGVIDPVAIGSALVVLLPLVALTIFAVVIRDVRAVSMGTGTVMALVLLTVNDVWGANAEPYRFWIEGLLIGGVVALLMMTHLWGEVSRRNRVEHRRFGARERTIAGIALVSAVLWGASLPDFVNQANDTQMQATWDPRTERERAVSTLASQVPQLDSSSLLTTEPCIDHRTAKVTSGSPIANYHLGMAWPENKAAIDRIITAREAGALDFEAMSDSGTRYVLTDSSCASAWYDLYDTRLEYVDSVDYELAPGELMVDATERSGTVTLWRVIQ